MVPYVPFYFSFHRFRHLHVEHLSRECFLYFLSQLQSLHSSPQTHIWAMGMLTVELILRVNRRDVKKASVSSLLLITRQTWKTFTFHNSLHAWRCPAGHQRLGQPTKSVLGNSPRGGPSPRAGWRVAPSRVYLCGCHTELLVRGFLCCGQSP